MPKYSCVFNPAWLENSKYKMWLQKTYVPNKAYCRICLKTFDISNMGESALTSHIKSNKHQQSSKSSSACMSISSFASASASSTSSVVKPLSSAASLILDQVEIGTTGRHSYNFADVKTIYRYEIVKTIYQYEIVCYH